MAESRHWFILALVIAGGWLLYLLAPVITPFAVAAGLAYVSDPLVDRLERFQVRSWRMGRTLAVVLVFVLLTLLLALSLLVLIPVLIRQARELIGQMPVFFDWLTGTALPWLSAWLGVELATPDLDAVREVLKNYWREISTAAFGVMETLGKGGQAVLAIVANLVLIPVVAFYLMRDWDRLVQNTQDLLPRARVHTISNLAAEIDEVLGAFLRGQLLVMFALGVIYAVGLMLIGLQAGFLIGLVAGLLSIVPYLGTFVGLGLAVAVSLFQFGDILHLVLVLVVFGVGQSLEGMVLTPKLVGDRIGLHPVAVIFAVLAGGQLFGFVGILLALPVAAALNVLVRHAHDVYQRSAWYAEGPG